jgi:hypothetical protein
MRVVIHDEEMKIPVRLHQHGIDALDAFAPAVPIDEHDSDGRLSGYRGMGHCSGVYLTDIRGI